MSELLPSETVRLIDQVEGRREVIGVGLELRGELRSALGCRGIDGPRCLGRIE
jgi:hypothetical protein